MGLMKLVAMIVLLYSFAWACSPADSTANKDEYCTTFMDCQNNKSCIDHVCKYECLTPLDCGDIAHFQCINNKCYKKSLITDVSSNNDVTEQPDIKTEQPDIKDIKNDMGKIHCTKHIDCDPYQMACINGFCDRECTKDEHCGDPNKYCWGYMCFDKDNKDVVDAKDVVDVKDIVDTKPDQSGCVSDILGCVTKPGQYGEPCKCKCECASELCVGKKNSDEQMCTMECMNNASCPGIDVCIPVSGTNICYPNDTGNQCASGCVSGLTLTNTSGNCQCTVKCNNASKCPPNYGCQAVKLNGGGATKMCVYAGGQACNPNPNTTNSPCFGICYPINNEEGFCTVKCDSTADCPSGMFCYTEPDLPLKTCQYY